MRVLVCGGRKYGFVPMFLERFSPEWEEAVRQSKAERLLLEETLSAEGITTLIQGGGDGADELAADWAFKNGVPIVEFEANWYPRGRAAGLDRSAGPKRNQRMLDEGKPDRVLAFPGGRGTADMISKAERAGVPVRRVTA